MITNHRAVEQKSEADVQNYGGVALAAGVFEHFFTFSHDLLGQVRFDGCFACGNPAIEQAVGTSVSGLRFLDFIHPEDVAASALEIEHLVRGKTNASFENRFRLRDGSYRWITWSVSADPVAESLYLDGRDITERKLADQKIISEHEQAASSLAQTSSLLETMLENSPDCIYFKDRESRFVRYSKSMLSLLHIEDPNGLMGKTDFDFFLEEHARAAFEDEQEIMRSGTPIIGKPEKETHPDGRVTWALTTKVPWRDKSGNVVGTYGMSKDITATKESENKLEQANKKLIETSRLAGMAEVATSVLHNVGNVLNSVNISAAVLKDNLRNSKVSHLAKAVSLMREHTSDLAVYITEDAKGKYLPEFFEEMAKTLTEERETMLQEMTALDKNIEHIKDIVAMQQSYARVWGVVEVVRPTDLVEDALRLNAGALIRHDVQVVREFAENMPSVSVEKHKVLQILVNLIRNAKYACDDSGRRDKKLIVRTVLVNGDRVQLIVGDNGVGIPPENLNRIFNHGFTTRRNGHGFGLHSGALAAREMGGSLTVHSDGVGTGASFTLELPLHPPRETTAA